ncbi:MAG: ATP-binding protein [Desulfobulbus sp.]|nr:ATP-binding protein [Desulfobulbus sp.]
MTSSGKNALAIGQYLKFLADMLRQRLHGYFEAHENPARFDDIKRLVSVRDDSELSIFIREHGLIPEEIVVLLLALAPHVRPEFFDTILNKELAQAGDFPQIGGTRGKQSRGFLPTGETALFLLAGDSLHRRFELQHIFHPEHLFAQKNILWLNEPEPGEPLLSGRIVIARDYLELFIHGRFLRPRLSMDFPAEYISTELSEEELVLPETTWRQLNELEHWIRWQEVMMQGWHMQRWLRPGYRALFHGPSGTGKTLAALILGKKTGKDVFRIDLSMVVSKFIGETEKNLSQLFERARSKDWILFFDEADALFGKRTDVRDAHDKYANQEVAYLLQRIESHDGLVILASNFKANIDEAFLRRFQSVVYFPLPGPEERYAIWQKVMPQHKDIRTPEPKELLTIAKKYELTGANIVNIVQFCCLSALAAHETEITLDHIKNGIEREFQKEGKVF